MHFFNYRNGELFCENVPVRELAKAFGTPLYIYSYNTIKRHFEVFKSAFLEIKHLICYSLKANSNLAILKILRNLGSGADIVSMGELVKALTAGIEPNKIVFSGVGKTKEEIKEAIRAGILMINIESEGELNVISEIARKMKKKAPISFRINPEIDPKTHPYITTGLKKNKFGVPISLALTLYRKAKKDSFLEVRGISSHIGSQITELEPFMAATKSLKKLFLDLKDHNIEIKYMDLGGGLGITYKDELPPQPLDYGKLVTGELSDLDITIILEPGRVIVGNSGIFLTKLLYVKRTDTKTFYIVDGAMNDLVRPAFYGSYHEIWPVLKKDKERIVVDVVGPICESSDFFAKDREIEIMEEGELLAVMSAGAYGFSMSSNYNVRRKAAEVLVKNEEYYLVRKRERYRDMIKDEMTPFFKECV